MVERRFPLANEIPHPYPKAMRMPFRAKLVLDNCFGNVKHSPNGLLQVLCGTRTQSPNRSCLRPNPGQPRTQAATENQHNKMQNYCKTIGALAAASALVAGNAQAEVEYEIHVGYSTEYIFRGADLGDDLVEAGVDISTEWNGLGLSAGAWYGSYDTAGGYDIDELDHYAEASKDLGFATAAVGYIYYYNEDFLNLVDDAQEVYFSLSRDFGFAQASLTYFWDIEGDNDGYAELGLSRGFELNQCLTLNVGATVGYMVEQSDFTALTTKVSLDWAFVENAKLSPFVAVSVPLSDVAGTYTGGSSNELFGGTMLSVAF
jgi:hypothetical protein